MKKYRPKVLVSTVGMEREEWLGWRRKGIGGSDAAAVAGLSRYSSPMKVYYDKIGEEILDEEMTECLLIGVDLEDYVARRFMKETGFKVRRANAIFYDPERPYMIADVDRIICGSEMNAGVEIKVITSYSSAKKWEQDQIPLPYYIQVLHYMSVMGMQEYYIVALIMGKGLEIRKVKRDEEIIRNLRIIEEDFWKNHVEKRILPDPDGNPISDKLILEKYPEHKKGKCIELFGFKEKLSRREELAELIETMEQEKKQIEQELKLTIGDAEYAVGEGYRVSWKNMITNRLDSDRLRNENPEVYKAFLKQNSTRKLLIKAA